jgi:pyruvate/2-oxoglutarate dehydrogenase complex dihydrolipoamide acyltransferase (E2) component
VKIEAPGEPFIPQPAGAVRFKPPGETAEIQATPRTAPEMTMQPRPKTRPLLPAAEKKTREGLAKASAPSVAARIEELERRLEQVRATYEAYFLGLERRPPELARQQVHHKLLELQGVPIINTAMRFRFQNLVQRFTQLAGHWNRTMREIEAGTYRRDLLKAARHMAARDGSSED